MKFKNLLSLLFLLEFSLGYANSRTNTTQKKNADENLLTLSQYAYYQGEYEKCIEYAENINFSIMTSSMYNNRSYNKGGHYETERFNALIHAYAAAACYQLSQHSQINDTSYKSYYAENSSFDYLSIGADHYLCCGDYFNCALLKNKVNSFTDSDSFIKLCHEISVAMTANLVEQEFCKAVEFYDKSYKKNFKKAKKEGEKFQNYYEEEIISNKSIIKDNISLYFSLYTSEILFSLSNKKNRKNLENTINSYIKDISNAAFSIGSPRNNRITYVDLRNCLKMMSQTFCILANENDIEWKTASNIYITYLNFCEYIKGVRKEFSLDSWNDIKQTLKPGEYILIFYEAPISSGTYYHVSQHNLKHSYAFVIGWDKDEVGLINRKLNASVSHEDFKRFQSWWPEMKSLYILPTEHIKTLDYAGSNPNIHMITSLSSLADRTQNEAMKYKIKIMANLKYSEYDDDFEVNDSIKTKGVGFYSLPNSKKEIAFLQNAMNENNLEILENEKGTKSALLKKGEENILHISTHGDVNQSLLDQLNQLEPLDGITGDNVLKSCYLALSKYNDVPHSITQLRSPENISNDTYISGYDITKHDLSHLNLVFLDACKTGYAKNVNGDTFSLVEAFKIAGAKNIIAYLEPVRDDIAATFAEMFYTNLFNEKNIHDSFYESKKRILDYEPELKIVLWE